MTLQSPKKNEERNADPYLESWQAMTHMIMEQGASWSGREKNCAYLNMNDGRFANVSQATHADYGDDARALALIDWDHDGALDLLIKNRTAPRLRFLRNQVGQDAHWVQFKLRGTGKSNRDAIGAHVTVKRDGQSDSVATLRAGDAYLSQSSRFLHFGLGDSAAPMQVEVRWPDGQVESFAGVASDKIYRLVQGSGQAVVIERPPVTSMASAPISKPSPSTTEERRIVLVDRLPMQPFPLPSYADTERTVASFEGGPVLINLWGLTCANCFKELAEFHDAADRLAAAGLRVVPLSTDPADQQEKAQETIVKMGHGELAGPTGEAQFDMLQMLFTELLGPNAPSYLPSSLLLDAEGRVCVVYQGPVSVETLLEDVASLGKMRAGARGTGQLQDGRWLADRRRDFAGLAAGLRAAGHTELASYYEELAARDAAPR
ncbi:MAG: hypothetical protein CMJ94_13950 [Planctomycetes bacterium]|nr:hypothetical protein [Planctomycetota bacterium]